MISCNGAAPLSSPRESRVTAAAILTDWRPYQGVSSGTWGSLINWRMRGQTDGSPIRASASRPAVLLVMPVRAHIVHKRTDRLARAQLSEQPRRVGLDDRVVGLQPGDQDSQRIELGRCRGAGLGLPTAFVGAQQQVSDTISSDSAANKTFLAGAPKPSGGAPRASTP